jgi:hypothetical protein
MTPMAMITLRGMSYVSTHPATNAAASEFH